MRAFRGHEIVPSKMGIDQVVVIALWSMADGKAE
jgi:hypothetical protein